MPKNEFDKKKSGYSKPQQKQGYSKSNYSKSSYSKNEDSDYPKKSYSKPYGEGSYSKKPYAAKSFSDKPRYDKPYSDKPYSDRPYSDKPRYDKPRSNKPYSDRPYSDKPRYDKPYSPKPFAAKSAKPAYKKDFKKAQPEGIEEKTFSSDNGAVPGRNAVRELLKSGRAIEKVYVREGEREGSITVLVSEVLSRAIPLVEVDRKKLDELCDYEQHQGIVAIAAEKEYVEIEELLSIAKERGEKPLIIIADGITDPHNLGAVIRCAEGAGAHGIIIPKRRAALLTPAVTKASAGALEHLAVVKCSNVADTVRRLKDYGLWIFAAEADGKSYLDADFSLPCAIVLGSEENGVSDVVKKNCDFTVSIPMLGKVNSLNVSTAAAVLLYEALRKRSIGE